MCGVLGLLLAQIFSTSVNACFPSVVHCSLAVLFLVCCAYTLFCLCSCVRSTLFHVVVVFVVHLLCVVYWCLCYVCSCALCCWCISGLGVFIKDFAV